MIFSGTDWDIRISYDPPYVIVFREPDVDRIRMGIVKMQALGEGSTPDCKTNYPYPDPFYQNIWVFSCWDKEG